MATRRALRLTRWDAQQRLAEQLSQLERNVIDIEASIPLVPPQLELDAGNVERGARRKLVLANRDVDLREKHRLDPWVVLSEDFLQVRGTLEQLGGFTSVIVGTGATRGMASGDTNHPGTFSAVGGSADNSGVAVSAGTIVLGGDEYVVCVFRTPPVFSNTRAVLGLYNDRLTLTEPTRGAYLWWSGGATLVGKTGEDSVYSTTSTSYTLAADTWHTGIVKVMRDGSSVSFKLYNDDGVLLWADTLASNVPMGRSHFAGAKLGVITGETSKLAGAVDFLETRFGGPGRPLRRYLGSADEVLT